MTGGSKYATMPNFSKPLQPSKFQSIEELDFQHEPATPCYLDSEKRRPAPDLYAYDGIPQFQPLPVLGSHDAMELRDDVCFDRYTRYGPYGLGYGAEDGGTDKGILKKSDKGYDHLWKEIGYIDYRNMDWGNAQKLCYRANKHRFYTSTAKARTSWGNSVSGKYQRQAVIIRTYTGYKWTQYAILNIRAMINEVSLKSGGQFDVHLLLHVRDSSTVIWNDAKERQSILDSNIPKEFHSLCTLWSEAQMKQYYPGGFGDNVENIAGSDIYTVYRSGHMPLQHFAIHHPEYAHFWNWEMDIRYIGSYYELLSKIGNWAAKEPRRMMWERSSTYYIPAVHGSWEDFSKYVETSMRNSESQPISGPVEFNKNETVDCVIEDYLPESCKGDNEDTWQCGVGEPADLITLNPIFDVQDSGWVFSKDITGYNITEGSEFPPRRSTIVTASRLSRRLLDIMHQETMEHRSMFTEMFPPSIALHYGLKAVYAPHPIYFDRAWTLDKVDRIFNGGKDNTTSGPGSPFNPGNEHNHKGTSYYYHAEFAGLLWRRWLGLSKGKEKGNAEGRSRLCLRSMLIHPVKWEE